VTLSNNTVSVPDVAISAPILWEVGGSTKEMNTALAQGVIHVAGTPRPGQQGFTAIAGHSSNYPWVKGDFNAIFAPLTQTVLGQTIELNYNGTMYRYQITKRYEVAPNQTEILNQHDRTGLRLITCTPVGTALRRLIIEADQVFPDPLQAAPFQGSANTAELPSGS
jgi:LPXTG-site transpeptidase (sortase) family protein